MLPQLPLLAMFGLLIMLTAPNCAQAQNIKSELELIKAHRATYEPQKIAEPDNNTDKLSKRDKQIKISGYHINQQLHTFTDSSKKYYEQIKSIPGYRILVYNGNEREKANQVKKKLYTLYGDLEVYLIFKQPSFRVLAGDFYDKLSCLQMIDRMKKDFPNAILYPDNVNIKR